MIEILAALFLVGVGGAAVWGITKYNTLQQDNEYAYTQLQLAREETLTAREDAVKAEANATFQKETLAAVLSRPVVATLNDKQAAALIDAVRMFLGANAVPTQ
jgi:hypothetical protein